LTCLVLAACGDATGPAEARSPSARASTGAATGERGSGAPAVPPDIVWIVVDALRADHADTPAIERLAADGLRFPSVYAHSPSTLPAHVAMLSSRRPVETGVVRDGQAVDAGLPLLPAWLAEHGYRTAAVVALDDLWPPAPGTGIDRGFARFERGRSEQSDASEVLATARELLEELDQGDGGPFFLFVHLADPHLPLRAHGSSDETAEIYVDGEAQLSIPVVEDGRWSGELTLPTGSHLFSIKSILPLEVDRMRATLELEQGDPFVVEAVPGEADLAIEVVGPRRPHRCGRVGHRHRPGISSVRGSDRRAAG
jgi:hypothetical protein